MPAGQEQGAPSSDLSTAPQQQHHRDPVDVSGSTAFPLKKAAADGAATSTSTSSATTSLEQLEEASPLGMIIEEVAKLAEDEVVTESSSAVHVDGEPHWRRIGQEVLESFEQRDRCDVRLFCGAGDRRRYVRAHRALLAAVSPMLRNIFIEVDPYQSKQVDISLAEMRYADLESLVHFLYTGQARVHRRRARLLQKWMQVLDMQLTLVEDNMSSSSASAAATPEAATPTTKTVVIGMEEPYPCDECPKTFKSEAVLKSHRLQLHSERRFSCELCGKKFRYKETLVSHTRSHTGESLPCDMCSKTFKHKRDLKDHYNIHTGTTRFSCDQCPAQFSMKKQLYNHKENHKTHLEPCKICGKRLKTMACYRAHMRNHTKTAAHSCATCGRGFKRGFDLKVHMRIHSGAKPYTCSTCHKSFSLSSTLAKHKRFHEVSQNVYACSLCAEAFTETDALADHLLKAHQTGYLLVEQEEGGPADGGGGGEEGLIVGELNEDGQVSLALHPASILPDNGIQSATTTIVVSQEVHTSMAIVPEPSNHSRQ